MKVHVQANRSKRSWSHCWLTSDLNQGVINTMESFSRVFSINTLPLYIFGVNAFELAGIAFLVFMARFCLS